MWNNKYDPPESIFDEIEPAVCIVSVIAMFAIILFTPLSPFANREQSALDQLAGVNEHTRQVGVVQPRNGTVRIRQVNAGEQSDPLIR